MSFPVSTRVCVLATLVGACCGFLSTRVIAQEPARAAPEIEYRPDVEYGTGAGTKLKLHLALPKSGEARPAILFIHGGGWAAGNKDQLVPAARVAAQQGFIAASIGYRLAPQHVFPAQVEDVKCAVRWMRAHADELKLDKDRIGAIGFSAGAHLSMMLGVLDPEDGLEGEGGWSDQSSKVQAVVSYFGPTNLTSDYPDATVPILQKFIGGTLAEKKDDYRRASPVTYVNGGDAPMLLLQGTDDPLVPFEQAFQMAEALTKSKVPGRVELLLNAKHGWGGDELGRTQRESMLFFRQHLKPAR